MPPDVPPENFNYYMKRKADLLVGEILVVCQQKITRLICNILNHGRAEIRENWGILSVRIMSSWVVPYRHCFGLWINNEFL